MKFHPSSEVHPSVEIGAFSVIGANVKIGAHSRIGRNCVIQDHVVIGVNCHIKDYVQVLYSSHISDQSFINSRSVIGSEGFGYTADKTGRSHYIPQIGSIEIGENSHIDSFCCFDRGSFKNTEIKKNSFIGSRSHIAHNLHLGENTCILYSFVIAGSSFIKNNFKALHHVAMAGHIEVAEGTSYGDFSRVTRSNTKAQSLTGTPPINPELEKEIDSLIKQLPDLEKSLNKI